MSVIKKQFAVTRNYLANTLEGISPEILDVIPEGFNNNIRWQVGHILATAEFFLFKGQETIPANYFSLFATGSKPADWNEEIPSLETLLEKINTQLVRINDLSDEVFNQELPEPIFHTKTVGELAAIAAFHEAMHLGQIQSMKRLLESVKVN
nr:DinB family protein [Lysinibacillus timonensis]